MAKERSASKKVRLQVKSWEEASEQLGEIKKLEAAISNKETVAEGKIAKLRQDLAAETEPLKADIEARALALSKFWAAAKGELPGDAKSKKLPNGTLGEKDKTTVNYPPDDELVEAVKREGLKNLVRRGEEKPDKTGIKKLAADVLARLGVVVETVQEFYYKTS